MSCEVSRVVHVIKIAGVAGAERHLLTLAAGQRAAGVDARIWALSDPRRPVPQFAEMAAANGVPVETLPLHGHFDRHIIARLAEEFRAAAPDLVHTHLIHADLHGVRAARAANVPHVVTSRHNDNRAWRIRLARKVNRRMWRKVDAGIAISEAVRQFILRTEGAPPQKLCTIHYGLDAQTVNAPSDARARLRAELGLPEEALLVGSVCRLIPQKGLSYGLRGFATMAAAFPSAHYVLAGRGPLHEALQAEAHTLGVGARVHFLGWREDAHAVMAALDVLLMPSLWEGFGLVLLEAMALGVPIVATRVSAIPEVVADGETGWLVPPRDPAAIAEALRQALSDPARRRAFGQAGRQRLETHFTARRMVERTLTLYRNLDAEHPCAAL